MGEADGTKSESLGPTALQRDQAPCVDADGNATEDGQCHGDLGATTVGLVYVNPEGPMSNPDPALSALDVQRTFTTMGHSNKTTVALVGGGHALGKCHGACKA